MDILTIDAAVKGGYILRERNEKANVIVSIFQRIGVLK